MTIAQTIGVIGGGVVGRATARCFMEHADVRVYDVDGRRATHQLSDVLACHMVFVCLPEAEVERSFASYPLDPLYVIKSTVPVGTTARIASRGYRVVHSPEFLTERCAVADACNPARNVIGGDDTQELCALYDARFLGVQTFCMTSNESEFLKLMQNSFFATKVSLLNEFRSVAEEQGLDWNTLLPAFLADGRVGSSHTKVPGPDGMFGFGGKCLPKDLAEFVRMAGHDAVVTAAALQRNRCHDRPTL